MGQTLGMPSRPTALSALALAALLCAGCKGDEKTPAPKTPKAKTPASKPAASQPATAKGIDKGDKRLAAVFKDVLKHCDISEWGFIRRSSCKKPGLQELLKKREKEVGQQATLLTYCYALGDDNHLGRALASFRITSINYAQRMAEAADAKIFDCLLGHFNKSRRAHQVRRLARAVTFMGTSTALKKTDAVLAAIKAHPLREARESAYEALWANGRLGVFATLEEAINKSRDPKLQIAAIKSFGRGPLPTPDERKKICALLEPMMTNSEIDVAAASAYRFAYICQSNKAAVVAAAKTLIGKGTFTLTYVTALRGAAGLFIKGNAPPKQRKAVVGVLESVVASQTVTALTRSSALSAIFDINPRKAKQLAKKYLKDKEKFVADEAARISKKRIPK